MNELWEKQLKSTYRLKVNISAGGIMITGITANGIGGRRNNLPDIKDFMLQWVLSLLNEAKYENNGIKCYGGVRIGPIPPLNN